MPAVGRHEYRKDTPLTPETFRRPGRELWVLHPDGESMPRNIAAESIQVLLLDGNWQQAADMARSVRPWGRRVCLPMQGSSRYWLRAQVGEGKFSTVEALLFLMEALGETTARVRLQAQFELHVHAGLLSRGQKVRAAEYLATSPVKADLAALLGRFTPSRL